MDSITYRPSMVLRNTYELPMRLWSYTMVETKAPSQVFQEGDKVLIQDKRGRHYLITLSPSKKFESHIGAFPHEDLIGQETWSVQPQDSKSVSLSDYRGKKNVVLSFHIFSFTGG